MTVIPEGLILKESLIHGNGIFSTKNYKKGFCFGPFIGIEMSIKDFHKTYGKDYKYCYRMCRVHKIISSKDERNFITYINDGIHNQTENKVNVILKNKFLYALRDILEGEELLLDYGYLYPWSKKLIELSQNKMK